MTIQAQPPQTLAPAPEPTRRRSASPAAPAPEPTRRRSGSPAGRPAAPLRGRAHRADRPTLGLDAQHPFGVDAYTLLDHRTRNRCVTRDLAPPGRYLEVEHEQRAYLIPLDRPITHIGRGLHADLRLEDPHVSRRHAIIAQRGDGARVLDDRSRHGVFVNGRSVSIGYLTDGDVLRLGRVVFRFIELAPQGTAPRRRIPLPVPARRRPSLQDAA
jgi:hypothetical protein